MAYLHLMCKNASDMNSDDCIGEVNQHNFCVLDTFCADYLNKMDGSARKEENMFGCINEQTVQVHMPALVNGHYVIVCVDWDKRVIKIYNSLMPDTNTTLFVTTAVKM